MWKGVSEMKKLARSYQLLGEHFRFFGEAARPCPIRALRRFPRILEKSLDLRDQIHLRGTQLLSMRRLQIVFRDNQALARLLLRGRSFFRRQLRNDPRRP